MRFISLHLAVEKEMVMLLLPVAFGRDPSHLDLEGMTELPAPIL